MAIMIFIMEKKMYFLILHSVPPSLFKKLNHPIDFLMHRVQIKTMKFLLLNTFYNIRFIAEFFSLFTE